MAADLGQPLRSMPEGPTSLTYATLKVDGLPILGSPRSMPEGSLVANRMLAALKVDVLQKAAPCSIPEGPTSLTYSKIEGVDVLQIRGHPRSMSEEPLVADLLEIEGVDVL